MSIEPYIIYIIIIILLMILLIFLLFYFKSYKTFKNLNYKNLNFRKGITQDIIMIMNEIDNIYSKIDNSKENIFAVTNTFKKIESKPSYNPEEEVIGKNIHVTYYLPYPNEDGTFPDDKSHESDFTRPFKLILNDEKSKEWIFEIVSSETMQKNLISHYHIYLTPVADIMNYNKPGRLITVIKRGNLELSSGKWIVKDKLQINIV